jgi:hypothetical protein
MRKTLSKIWIVDEDVSDLGAESIYEMDAILIYKTAKEKKPIYAYTIDDDYLKTRLKDGTYWGDEAFDEVDIEDNAFLNYSDAIDYALEVLDDYWEGVMSEEYKELRAGIINKRNGLERAIAKATKK